MDRKIFRRMVAGSAIIASAIAATSPAWASAPASGRSQTTQSFGSSAVAATAHQPYSDKDVVNFVVFARGLIADRHPDLASKIRGSRPPASVTDTDVSTLTAALMKLDSSFHSKVTMGVQRNDPYAAQTALERLNVDIKQWLQTNSSVATPNGMVSPDGFWSTKSNIYLATNIVLVIEGAVYSTVAAGAEAVVVVAIVPAAVSYSFEMDKSSHLQKQRLTVSVTRACASAA